MGEDELRKAVLEGCPGSVEADVTEYLADMAVSVLEENSERDAFAEALSESYLPFLEDSGVSDEDAKAFCSMVVNSAFPTSQANVKDNKGGAAVADLNVLCRLPNLLMMYGGSTVPLLRNTTLEFVKGHRYGVVGANGTGKTTLMERIATKDIAGMPQTIRVVHLSHDKILRGVDATTTVKEYAELHGCDKESASSADLALALSNVGFDDEAMLGKAVVALSGGWQMRLSLACAVAQKANLLLLDEPTNHLDTAGVRWLVDFLNRTCIGGDIGGTALIISHDAEFLDQVCTDVVHFTTDARLAYHPGNFSKFKADVLRGDQEEADRLLENGPSKTGGGVGASMDFPAPEKIGQTAAARKAPVLTLQNVVFSYVEGQVPVLSDVNVKLSMESRVAIVGANGAGKSTLLSLMADRLKLSGSGELWWHKQLRLAYVSQQHLDHLGDCLHMSPVDYMQQRFRSGFDSETPEKEAKTLSASEETERKRCGIQFGKKSKPIQALLSRMEQVRHAAGNGGAKEFLYEVQWEGLGDAEITWERKGKLLQCGCEAMVDDLDERLWRAWAGVPQRPLSTEEVVRHLSAFGLAEDIVCNRKVAMLSSGQKIKLMFGAAFWTRPHVLCLDEPTNYLDAESVGMLQEALKGFRGGYAIVTHHDRFAEEVADETWTVADGQVSGAKRVWGKAKAKAKATSS